VAAQNGYGIGEFAEFDDTFTPAAPLEFTRELDNIVVNEGGSLELCCEVIKRCSNLTFPEPRKIYQRHL